MKSTTKIILITALGLILAGFLLGVGTLAIAGLPFGQDYRTYRTEHDAALAIRTDLDSATLYLRQTDGDRIVVICNDLADDRCTTVTERGGVLEIDHDARPWYADIRSWISFGEDPEYDVEIGIPAGYAGKLTIESSSGGIEVEDVTLPSAEFALSSGFVKFDEVDCTGTLRISASSGAIVLDEVRTAGALTVSATSGAMRLSDIDCAGDLTTDANSGALRLEMIRVKGTLTATRSSGTITGERITCQGDLRLRANSGVIRVDIADAASLEAKTTSGALSFDELTADDIHLEATSSIIRAEINGRMSDYNITSGTTSGSNNLPENQSGSGGKTLVALTTSGSINVTFD